MPFPVEVALTTVTEKYYDAVGGPAKGYATFIPDLAALGEDTAVVPVPVRKKLDSTGTFTVDLLPGEDFTYEYNLQLEGGVYIRRVYQIPASESPISIEDLIPVEGEPASSRFAFPNRATAPTNPRPGQTYYNTVTGSVNTWDEVTDAWVSLSSGGGGGGAPSGPAGGSLTGTYPNPTLAANSVGTGQLADDSVTAAKLSVDYVPVQTYTNDLAITAGALGDLEEMIDLRAPIASPTFTGTVSGVTKSMVGLSNVDNTSDANKPVSTAQQTALNLKANLASPTFTGTVSGITASMVGLGNVNNTSDANKPISAATQTALNAKADLVGGVIPTAQIPAYAVTEVFTVANQAAMLALTAQRGDMAIRTDNGHRYVLSTDSPGTLADWVDLGTATDAVASVNGQTGIVVLGKADVGLSNVDNTTDANKPVSSAQQTALDLKADLANPSFTGVLRLNGPAGTFRQFQIASGATEEDIRWSIHANNTAEGGSDAGSDLRVVRYSDAGVALDAPLSIDRSDGKVSISSLEVLTNATGITATMVGLGNVNNTSDANKPISTATQTALDSKAASVHTHTAAQVTDLSAAVARAFEKIQRNADIGEYIIRRQDIITESPALTGNLYVTTFVGANTEARETIRMRTGGTVAVGGEHAWIGFGTWDKTVFTPLVESADIPTLWSDDFAEYDVELLTPFNEVEDVVYGFWVLWIGSGQAPSLPAGGGWYADALVDPWTNMFMGSQTAPPSAPLLRAWFGPDSRRFQALMLNE
jgi:hypothetical protein